MASQKKGDRNRELSSASSLESETHSVTNMLVEDTPDALLVLANRLQKALDARSVNTDIKKASRARRH
ncbi:hypothetical protein [Ensifer sp.]|uniref:hypothetical protein n=1 Tax=Ensifer sp. TaxID=1872086 RepID=UPI0028A293B9|nr:hypothetical protein [Ensifer sp.]